MRTIQCSVAFILSFALAFLMTCLLPSLSLGQTASSVKPIDPKRVASSAERSLLSALKSAQKSKASALSTRERYTASTEKSMRRSLKSIATKLKYAKREEALMKSLESVVKEKASIESLPADHKYLKSAFKKFNSNKDKIEARYTKSNDTMKKKLSDAKEAYEASMQKAIAAVPADKADLGKALRASLDKHRREIDMALSEGLLIKPGKMVDVKAKDDNSYSYWLYVPKDYQVGYSKNPKNYPMVMFLHGMGERGHNLDLVAKNGPPRHVKNGEHYPFILISPQCPKNAQGKGWWNNQRLVNLVDDVSERLRVDTSRMYCTGLSMGGIATYALAMHAPHKFAAIAPVAANGSTGGVDKIKHLPVWAFHGDKDNVVKYSAGKAIADALKDAGADITFTVYPGVGHNSWGRAYKTPELYTWLLSHSR